MVLDGVTLFLEVDEREEVAIGLYDLPMYPPTLL
jgi:hypothetical protein